MNRLLPALICAATAGPLLSQVEPPQPVVRPNAELRVLLADSTVLLGRLVSWEKQRILLNEIVRPSVTESRLVPRSIALDSVSAAWVRSGSHWKRGAIVGTVVGAGGMAVGFAIALNTQDPSSCSAGCWMEVLGIGAVTGGVLGGLVGHQFVVWRPLRF